MAQLHRLESDDPWVGGFLVTFPSGTKKTVCWKQEAVISPALEAAKSFVAALIDGMLNAPHVTNADRQVNLDDIERTNIPSLVAAVHKIVRDWNGERAEALYAANPTHQRLLGANGLPISTVH
jgi:hypothetical protein